MGSTPNMSAISSLFNPNFDKHNNRNSDSVNFSNFELALLKNYKSSDENNKSKHLKEKYLKEMNKWKSISFEGVINFCKK